MSKYNQNGQQHEMYSAQQFNQKGQQMKASRLICNQRVDTAVNIGNNNPIHEILKRNFWSGTSGKKGSYADLKYGDVCIS
jgi:hypothetical protein